jgi:protein-disulfide isomerase
MSKKKSNATRRAENLAASERAAAIRKEQEAKERRRRTVVVTAVIGAVLALILAAGYAVQSSRDTTGQATTPPDGVVEKYAVPRGDSSAPVTVTVYEDFMCPFCGDFEAASRDVLQKYVADGDVQVHYRVLSFLDRASSGSEYSTRAMSALGVVLDTSGAEVAGKFHDLLYENQPEEGSEGLSDGELVDLAVQAGADKGAVQGPIEAVKFEQWVKNATDDSSKAGVTSTPTVLVDGKKLEFSTIDDLMSQMTDAIEAGLAK